MAMLTSHVAFPLIGLASLLLGWPLARRRVPPNRWYGVRLRATLSSPAVWYEVNAICGDDLVRLGLVSWDISRSAWRSSLSEASAPQCVAFGSLSGGA
jgi:SdpI/YhfL family protein